jgi:hypothetical protein
MGTSGFGIDGLCQPLGLSRRFSMNGKQMPNDFRRPTARHTAFRRDAEIVRILRGPFRSYAGGFDTVFSEPNPWTGPFLAKTSIQQRLAVGRNY